MVQKDLNSVSGRANLTLNIVFFIYAALCILPLALLIIVSFTDQSAFMENGYQYFPSKLSLTAYKYLFQDFGFVARAYGITILVTVVGALLHVLFNSMYAYPLSRREFPFKTFFSWFILITILFSAGMPPFYYIYVRVLHVKNTLWAMLLPGLGVGFNMFIMRTYYRQNVPAEIIESAKIDGAGEFRTFFGIIYPISLPILATVGLFSTINYWNDFMNCMFFIDKPELFNLQFLMQKALLSLEFMKSNLSLMGAAAGELSMTKANIPTETVRMAMVVVGIGPIILAYPFFQKFFIRGLTVGSIKG